MTYTLVSLAIVGTQLFNGIHPVASFSFSSSTLRVDVGAIHSPSISNRGQHCSTDFITKPTRTIAPSLQLLSKQNEQSSQNESNLHNDIFHSSNTDNAMSRRTAMQSIMNVASVTSIVTSFPSNVFAGNDAMYNENQSLSKGTTMIQDSPNLKCLLDLPPIPSDSVRLYLCRHGQTEYNRLKQIQGARIDAPLNETGMKQATRLGKALSHLGDTNEAYMLKAGVHSNMLRARQTASIAATTLESIVEKKIVNTEINDYSLGSDDDTVKFVSDRLIPTASNGQILQQNAIQLQSLAALGEVDFGPLNEGKPSSLARADMYGTYGAWAIGKIDTTLGGGGESGREVLTRAASALNSLVDVAVSNGGSAVAVSHSTYLRMLLALAMDVPLSDAAAIEQKNCCINVLDVSIKEKRDVGPKSNLFGLASIVPEDFSLNIPCVNVVKINEMQHLQGLL